MSAFFIFRIYYISQYIFLRFLFFFLASGNKKENSEKIPYSSCYSEAKEGQKEGATEEKESAAAAVEKGVEESKAPMANDEVQGGGGISALAESPWFRQADYRRARFDVGGEEMLNFFVFCFFFLL